MKLSEAPGTKSRILLIDDDPWVGHILELQLGDSFDVCVLNPYDESMFDLIDANNYEAILVDFMLGTVKALAFFPFTQLKSPAYIFTGIDIQFYEGKIKKLRAAGFKGIIHKDFLIDPERFKDRSKLPWNDETNPYLTTLDKIELCKK